MFQNSNILKNTSERLLSRNQGCNSNSLTGRDSVIQVFQKMAQNFLEHLKTDLQSVNFSCANGTLHWRMFSFQSSFEENEICIICRATCFKHKATKELKIKNFDFRSSYQKCSVEKKNRKCHKKTTVSESLFNKFSDIFSLATFELP